MGWSTKGPSTNSEEIQQLFLPTKHRESVLRSLHDEHGHLGAERTFKLVRDRFYWPCMRAEVESYCHSCLRCIQRKTLPTRTAPMSHLQSQGPMDLVCIDFLCLEPDASGQGNILIVTDHFTRYAQAFSTKDQRTPTVAKVLMEKFFVHYGLPRRIHSDQGRDFESRLVGQLLELLGIQKTRTTPYHPQGDAQTERFNRTLLNMLGTLSNVEKQSWSRHIATLVHAYNSTESDATGYSPYRLMFGREARLPVDLAFGLSLDQTSVASHRNYVDRLWKNLASAFEQARLTSGNREQRNKRNYDLKVRIQDLQPGDRVLLKNLGVAARHKLADRWSSQVYIVCKQLPGIPVYQIRPDGKAGPLKNWHRNHLLPLREAVRMPVGDEPPLPNPPVPCLPPVTRSQQTRVVEGSERDSEEESFCLDWIRSPEPEEITSVPERWESNLRPEAPEFLLEVPETVDIPEPLEFQLEVPEDVGILVVPEAYSGDYGSMPSLEGSYSEETSAPVIERRIEPTPIVLPPEEELIEPEPKRSVRRPNDSPTTHQDIALKRPSPRCGGCPKCLLC
uniref:Gypsy retrotransposon integrase-like protein 1 n=1 Tax=Leptobrachium leishanense TaxID=445787 RepID=A0A8C5PK00_9ANUR